MHGRESILCLLLRVLQMDSNFYHLKLQFFGKLFLLALNISYKILFDLNAKQIFHT